MQVKGERLYEAARRGETVARKERRVVVNSFEVSRFWVCGLGKRVESFRV
jgi:tRNA U55 pseudouridine synthase TruB